MIPAAHVIFVLDDSGSMSCSSAITKKSFDGMVEALQLCKGADIVMTLIKYGSCPVLTFARTHIQEVKPINYKPNSAHDTIYDSMMYAIRLAKESPREEKTIIILQADGGDTCSRARPSDVFSAVSEAKKRGMEFLFLGANHYGGHEEYLELQAKNLGFEENELIKYSPDDGHESFAAFEETAVNIGAVASRTAAHAAYTKEQQSKVRKG